MYDKKKYLAHKNLQSVIVRYHIWVIQLLENLLCVPNKEKSRKSIKTHKVINSNFNSFKITTIRTSTWFRLLFFFCREALSSLLPLIFSAYLPRSLISNCSCIWVYISLWKAAFPCKNSRNSPYVIFLIIVSCN